MRFSVPLLPPIGLVGSPTSASDHNGGGSRNTHSMRGAEHLRHPVGNLVTPL